MSATSTMRGSGDPGARDLVEEEQHGLLRIAPEGVLDGRADDDLDANLLPQLADEGVARVFVLANLPAGRSRVLRGVRRPFAA